MPQKSKSFTLNIDSQMIVLELKMQIERQEDIPMSKQKLIHAGAEVASEAKAIDLAGGIVYLV